MPALRTGEKVESHIGERRRMKHQPPSASRLDVTARFLNCRVTRERRSERFVERHRCDTTR
jgi:hypothetical protein